MKKTKYHRSIYGEYAGACMGPQCLICAMRGRKRSLYGELIRGVNK